MDSKFQTPQSVKNQHQRIEKQGQQRKKLTYFSSLPKLCARRTVTRSSELGESLPDIPLVDEEEVTLVSSMPELFAIVKV